MSHALTRRSVATTPSQIEPPAVEALSRTVDNRPARKGSMPWCKISGGAACGTRTDHQPAISLRGPVRSQPLPHKGMQFAVVGAAQRQLQHLQV